MKKKRYEKKHNVIWSKIFIFMWISWSYILFLVISDFHGTGKILQERKEKKRKDEEIEKENLKKCKKRKEKNS